MMEKQKIFHLLQVEVAFLLLTKIVTGKSMMVVSYLEQRAEMDLKIYRHMIKMKMVGLMRAMKFIKTFVFGQQMKRETVL